MTPRSSRAAFRAFRPPCILHWSLALVAGLACVPWVAAAFTPDFPAPATALGERRADLTSYRLPTGPFRDNAVPVQTTEGSFAQTAWRLDAASATTLQLLAPLRVQIGQAGWQTLYECETEACGGFDFRYGIDVLPEPEMHVDLGDFRFLSARRDGPDGAEYLSLLVSRSADQGFVQLTLVGTETQPALTASTKSPEIPEIDAEAAKADVAAALAAQTPAAPAGLAANLAANLAATLDAGASYPLDDLVFASGMGQLAAGDYASLAALGAWLAAHPDAAITLVGHSDSSGNLSANTDLSTRRAQAVRDALVRGFSIDPARIGATGIGPAEPRAGNDTAEGRRLNRRVEVSLAAPT